MLRASILLLLASCVGRPTPADERLPFDAARTGAPGSQGPHRVVHTKWQAQSRVTESIQLDATYAIPIDGAEIPIVVFVQAAAAAPARYQWLFDHIASRGYTVIAPGHLADIPLIELDNATIALDSAIDKGLAAPNMPVALVGHSYGATIAARTFAADLRFTCLALLGGVAGPGDLGQHDRPALAISGTNDLRWNDGQVRFGILRYDRPRFFSVISGMNHYAWTDTPTEREIASDGPLEIPLQTARAQATRVLDLYLDVTLKGDRPALDALVSIVEEQTSVP